MGRLIDPPGLGGAGKKSGVLGGMCSLTIEMQALLFVLESRARSAIQRGNLGSLLFRHLLEVPVLE